MQPAMAMIGAAAVLVSAMTPGDTAAAEYVEIGHTGLALEVSTPDQPKHYVTHEDDLLERVAVLMRDADRLLVRLHALEPELALTAPVRTPIDAELGELFGIALRCNPALRKPRSELAVLAARTRQAGADMDPRASFQIMEIRTPFGPLSGTGGLGVSIGLSKEFVSYGKRGLRREIASYEEALIELELAQMELDLLLELTDAYYDLFGAVVRLRALDQNVELMQVLLELAERRLAVGAAPQAAVLSGQVQLSRMELMRIELRREGDKLRERVYGLLGRPADFDIEALRFDAPYPLPPVIEWHIGKLADEALNRHPAYQAARVRAEQQELSLELARREYHPDYMLMGEYEVGVGMQDRVMVGVEFPLFTNKRNRQDAMLQEEYAEQAVIEDEAAAIASEFVTRLRDFQLELQMHGELVDLLRLGSLPQARLAFESNIGGYSAGMMDFADLIMAQQALLEQELALEENYIHILHTLTDLHVLTLGAFDPLPFLSPAQRPAEAVGQPLVIAPDSVEPTGPPAPDLENLSPDAVGHLEGAVPPIAPVSPGGSEPDRTEDEGGAGEEEHVPDRGEPERHEFYRPFEPREARDG